MKKFLNSLGVAALLVTGLTLGTTLESKAQTAPNSHTTTAATPVPDGKYIAGGSGTQEDPYQLADIASAGNGESTTSVYSLPMWGIEDEPFFWQGGSGYGWWYLNL